MSQKLCVYSMLAVMKETENFVPQKRVWCILFITGKWKGKGKDKQDTLVSHVLSIREKTKQNKALCFVEEAIPLCGMAKGTEFMSL